MNDSSFAALVLSFHIRRANIVSPGKYSPLIEALYRAYVKLAEAERQEQLLGKVWESARLGMLESWEDEMRLLLEELRDGTPSKDRIIEINERVGEITESSRLILYGGA